MPTFDCNVLVRSYLGVIGQGFLVKDYEDDACQIVTPFWRPDGDHVEFFAFAAPNDSILITDEGQTFDWLFSVGVDIEGHDAREELVADLVARYGISLKDGILSIQVEQTNLGPTLHRFLSALNAISHLTLLRQQRGKPTFQEEVEAYLRLNQQVFVQDYKVKGRTLEHKIDFFIDSGRNMLVEALTATAPGPAKSASVRVAFEWIDIREAGWDFQKVTLLDDSKEVGEQIWTRSKIRSPLETYSDKVLMWSQRVQLLAPLLPGRSG